MQRLIPRFAGPLFVLCAARPAWACAECRAQVNSGVYGPDFTTILFVMLLPVIVLLLIGVGVYYADDLKARIKGRTGKWQTAQHAHR